MHAWELNAAQSPLTMSNCAQCEMAGSCLIALAADPLGASQVANKNPCLLQGLHSVLSWLIGSEAEEFGWNSIQAVIAHHLEDDVDQHSSNVKAPTRARPLQSFSAAAGG